MPEEVTRYEDWQFDRLEVPPGISGLWQVSGRSDLSFDDCVRLDLFYIENWSLAYDLYILAKTIPVLVSARSVLTRPRRSERSAARGGGTRLASPRSRSRMPHARDEGGGREPALGGGEVAERTASAKASAMRSSVDATAVRSLTDRYRRLARLP